MGDTRIIVIILMIRWDTNVALQCMVVPKRVKTKNIVALVMPIFAMMNALKMVGQRTNIVRMLSQKITNYTK